MIRTILLILFFVLLNMLLGAMFQHCTGGVCYLELYMLAVIGFIFWGFLAKYIKVFVKKWSMTNSSKNILIHGGIGLTITVFNILVAKILVIVLMAFIYNCSFPKLSILDISLTNNIAVNLFCYFALSVYFFPTVKKDESKPTLKEATSSVHPLPITPQKVSSVIAVPKSPKIEVTHSGSKIILNPLDIVFIEAANNCIIIQANQGKYVKYQSLKSIEAQLPRDVFKRVHRSYVVNVSLVERIDKNKNGDGVLYLTNGWQIRFSRTYRHVLQQLSD